MTFPTATEPARCDMSHDCNAAVTHIGSDGYVYCPLHAIQRRQTRSEQTRKMRPWELRWISEGRALPTYRVAPEPVA